MEFVQLPYFMNYSKTMFIGLNQVYYWRFECNTKYKQ